MQLGFHLYGNFFVASQQKDCNLLGDMKKLMNYLLGCDVFCLRDGLRLGA